MSFQLPNPQQVDHYITGSTPFPYDWTLRLECTEGNSNKAWSIDIEACVLTATPSWGRIGSKMQTGKELVGHRAIAKKVTEKFNKGYQVAEITLKPPHGDLRSRSGQKPHALFHLCSDQLLNPMMGWPYTADWREKPLVAVEWSGYFDADNWLSETVYYARLETLGHSGHQEINHPRVQLCDELGRPVMKMHALDFVRAFVRRVRGV